MEPWKLLRESGIDHTLSGSSILHVPFTWKNLTFTLLHKYLLRYQSCSTSMIQWLEKHPISRNCCHKYIKERKRKTTPSWDFRMKIISIITWMISSWKIPMTWNPSGKNQKKTLHPWLIWIFLRDFMGISHQPRPVPYTARRPPRLPLRTSVRWGFGISQRMGFLGSFLYVFICFSYLFPWSNAYDW